MDSVYITCKKPRNDIQNFYTIIDCLINYKYDFHNTNNDGKLPDLVISKYLQKGDDIDAGNLPNIYATCLENEDIYERNEYYPVEDSGEEYFPIIDLECRDEMFLLEFIIKLLEHNADFYVANTRLNTLDLSTLKRFLAESNHSWQYYGIAKKPRNF
ncbi:hypothetical protein [Taibaiella soli]|uniref:Uncharacterized protein n=1 Tax=Taibaiella soli TaxID=1649169 RepID=A0A2W2AIC2_9BACT|nr:hypothetical protein [Taibaiella soli]PZF75031.1 hypothetical protein DN068_00310 [Taibaiella soli]